MLISTLLLNNSSSASGTPRQEAFSTGWLLSTGEEKQQQTWYLKSIVFWDSFHHIRNSSLKDLFKSQWVHHCEYTSKMLQNFLFLFHSDCLTVGYSNVRLSISCYLNLWQLRKWIDQLQNCSNLSLLFLKKDLSKTHVILVSHAIPIQLEVTKANIDNKYMKMECEDHRLQNHSEECKKNNSRYHTAFVKLLDSKSCTFTFQQHFL